MGTGIGTGISTVLLVVGAIFVFALEFTLTGLDVPVVGIILMAAGALGLALSLANYIAQERRRAHGESAEEPPYWYYHRGGG